MAVKVTIVVNGKEIAPAQQKNIVVKDQVVSQIVQNASMRYHRQDRPQEIDRNIQLK